MTTTRPGVRLPGVRVRVRDPFPVVKTDEMDISPDILKYSDVRFRGYDVIGGDDGDARYKRWRFNVKGHYVEIWKDVAETYGGWMTRVDGDVTYRGNKYALTFKYPWFKEFL
jgi:hypothetical protein